MRDSILQDHAHTKLSNVTSTTLQMSWQEPHNKSVQVPPKVLLLWESLHLQQKARTAKMHKLSCKPQTSIKMMLIKDQHDLSIPRADGTWTITEDNQPWSTDHQANTSTMEGATSDMSTMESAAIDTGIMEGTTTDTGTMEGVITDTGTSMPSTSSLPKQTRGLLSGNKGKINQ